MIKSAANAFLATRISFVNEIAALCERTGAGPGHGGSCLPKDTRALARIGQAHGLPMRIIEPVIEINEGIEARMIEKRRDLCEGSFNGRTVWPPCQPPGRGGRPRRGRPRAGARTAPRRWRR